MLILTETISGAAHSRVAEKLCRCRFNRCMIRHIVVALVVLLSLGGMRTFAQETRPVARPAFSQERSSLASHTRSAEQSSATCAPRIVAAPEIAKLDHGLEQTENLSRSVRPFTLEEREKVSLAVGACWNAGSLLADARATSVTVAFCLSENGSLVPDTIRLVRFEGGGSLAEMQLVYEGARRAILRCGVQGFDLPPARYTQWQEIQLVFNEWSISLLP